MHFLQKINVIFTCFTTINYVNVCRRDSQWSMSYGKTPHLALGSNTSPPCCAHVPSALLKGRASCWEPQVSAQPLSAVYGAGWPRGASCTSSPLGSVQSLPCHCRCSRLAVMEGWRMENGWMENAGWRDGAGAWHSLENIPQMPLQASASAHTLLGPALPSSWPRELKTPQALWTGENHASTGLLQMRRDFTRSNHSDVGNI